LELPKNAVVLDIQIQHGSNDPSMWVMLDTNEPCIPRRFIAIGTGQKFDDTGLKYIATFQQPDLGLVWHIFEKVRETNGKDNAG
jgi:hypothetical protein